ncbi:uncharacterized protein [Polyergus mexicanus]|uniref:uncharacterized protein n=1 Tax=Polyergus mexicanus TaxID=615972 RepID=UPI0038B5B3E7
MPEHKRKRSRSRSKDDHRHKHIREKKLNDMQKQLDNLTKVVEVLVHVQKEQKPANQSTEIETDDTEIFDVEENKENNPNSEKDSNTEVIDRCIQQNQSTEDIYEESTLKDNVLKVLGVDLNESKFEEVKKSVARKSCVTPQLNKNIKPTVDAMISDEWLYSNNLKEKVKDAEEIEKACAEIKDKVQQKYSSKSNRGNSKYPPANYRQVGYQQKRRQFRFKRRVSQNSTQGSSKTNSQTTSQSSSKK